jgi:hypothetical protein
MSRPLSRVALATLFSAILVLSAVVPTAADGPIYRGPEQDWSGPIEGMCAFTVWSTTVQTNKVWTVWVLDDGTKIDHGTGGGVVTMSANGITVTVKLHGDVHQVFYPDGSGTVTWTGNHLVPELGILMRGRTQIHWDSLGNVSVSISPHNSSICAALTP